MRLFPLDRARGFGSDVVDDPVDARDFVGDANGDFFQNRVGDLRPMRGHEIFRGYGAHDYGIAVSSKIALHAHGADVGNHGKILLDVETGFFYFFSDYRVCGLEEI